MLHTEYEHCAPAVYGPSKAFYIAEGGKLVVAVAPSVGYKGRGLWFLSPKVYYDLSGGSCALGERDLYHFRAKASKIQN